MTINAIQQLVDYMYVVPLLSKWSYRHQMTLKHY